MKRDKEFPSDCGSYFHSCFQVSSKLFVDWWLFLPLGVISGHKFLELFFATGKKYKNVLSIRISRLHKNPNLCGDACRGLQKLVVVILTTTILLCPYNLPKCILYLSVTTACRLWSPYSRNNLYCSVVLCPAVNVMVLLSHNPWL